MDPGDPGRFAGAGKRRDDNVGSQRMPSDVKAILSVIALAVAAAVAYWETSIGNGHLFWFLIGFGVFAVVAMWVFPEAVGKTDAKNKG
jgi:hypothetical protein